MHKFVVHSNESACIKSVRLGLDQVNNTVANLLRLSENPGNERKKIRNQHSSTQFKIWRQPKLESQQIVYSLCIVFMGD